MCRSLGRSLPFQVKSNKRGISVTDPSKLGPLNFSFDSSSEFTLPMSVQISKLVLTELFSGVSETKSEGNLRPITSNDTGRYETTGWAEPNNMQISSGLFIRSLPDYLPLHWSAHIHPGGQLYFCRDGSPRVVTEAYLHRPETLGKVTRWIKKIEDTVADKSFPISDQVELFIEIEGEDCAYYFKDIDTFELGLPPVVSLSQRNILCKELYWTHVERFPMHFGGLSRTTVDSLVCVFKHAICDHMTSRVSTFPYSKEECETFLSLLKNSRDHVADGNTTWVVAIGRNRHLTHYDQYSLDEFFDWTYSRFKAGDPYAFYHALRKSGLTSKNTMGLKELLCMYGVPWIDPNFESFALMDSTEICAAGMTAISQLRQFKDNFNIDNRVDSGAAKVTEDLKAYCDGIEPLLRKGNSSRPARRRIEDLLKRMRVFETVDFELLRGQHCLSRFYYDFYELATSGVDTTEIIRELRTFVQGELLKATQRGEEFEKLRRIYTEGGRKISPPRRAGFRGGDAPAVEREQIHEELRKIDEKIANLGVRLKNSKEYWEKMNRDLKNTLSTYRSQRAENPPDGDTCGPLALQVKHIHAGLCSVHDVAQQYSPKLLEAGNKIIRHVSELTEKCAATSRTQSSVELQLRAPACTPKSGRKAVKLLTKGLGGVVQSCGKLSKQFVKYSSFVHLILWFAGTGASERMNRPADHLAQAILETKGLCSHLRPFESAVIEIEEQVCEMKDF
ncbi:hypothetical protein DFH09DRAFT_1196682 [Mycena vulgaris]|nr:hypothetical protein DFH09DRAFT_1196682 [Mycena vulgaris]